MSKTTPNAMPTLTSQEIAAVRRLNFPRMRLTPVTALATAINTQLVKPTATHPFQPVPAATKYSPGTRIASPEMGPRTRFSCPAGMPARRLTPSIVNRTNSKRAPTMCTNNAIEYRFIDCLLESSLGQLGYHKLIVT
ncbi:MAG: hypothetical protein E6I13_03690 [Chloroflexi bacterium]|nr:MAG: hypothetical protein E6I13_03690 [Chloroflexota bacterium]